MQPISFPLNHTPTQARKDKRSLHWQDPGFIIPGNKKEQNVPSLSQFSCTIECALTHSFVFGLYTLVHQQQAITGALQRADGLDE